MTANAIGTGAIGEPTYIVVSDGRTRAPVHFDVVDEALRINTILTPAPFDLSSIRQHPSCDCCESCIEDAAYDSIYSMYPQCCCRSEIPVEWLEARLGGRLDPARSRHADHVNE